MSLLNIFSKNRCKICKVNRGSRFCLRIGKDICWLDCNKMRIDQKCPEECDYVLRKADDFNLKTKTDSLIEYQDLLKRQMNKWAHESQQLFNGKIPAEMAKTEEGNKKLTTFFSDFKFNAMIPLSYLKEMLNLENLDVKDEIKNYEHTAIEFLNLIIIQEWEKAVEMYYFPENDQNSRKVFLQKRLQKYKTFRNLHDHELISSAVTKDKKQALVHFELNQKDDFTLRFQKVKNDWKITAKIFAKPEYFNSENEAIQQVAVLLSKNELNQAFELLQKFNTMYIDSADFEYYFGLYYSFSKNIKKAKEHFRNAMFLDPEFIEAEYNYAYTLHAEGDIEVAKKLYCKILKRVPDEPKTLNNLASILIDEQKYEEAENLLNRSLEAKSDFKMAQDNLERLKKLEKK